ncbi:MAG: translocation/assembly module TamB domain-containing protein, partial [Acidobacteriaceae bacterium]|nr:translocation/assembly module TamB domain-containing protein [Acidobacteriaceae bacterium]
GDLTITPSTGAIPISGQLTGQYSERTKELTLSKADVALPHSRAAFTGVVGKQLAGSFESTDLQDLKPLVPTYQLPAIKGGGTAAFDGTLSGASGDLRVAGNVHLAHANWRGWDLDDARASFDATSTGIRFGSLSLAGPTLQATGSGDIELQNWSVSPNASLSTRLHVAKADLAQLFVPYLPPGARDLQGSASGTFDIKGHLDHPYGRGNIEISKLQVFGEQVTKLEASVEVSGSQVTVSNGRLHDGLASLLFSAGYQRSGDDWRNGRVQLKADSNPFPLAVIDSIHRYNPTLNAQTELHAKVTASIRPGHFDLLQADGSLSLQKLSVEKTRIGDFAFRGRTDGQVLETNISGRFEATDITGNAEVRLIEGNPIRGQLQFAKIDLGTLRSVFSSGSSTFFPLNGSVAGSFVFDGELEHPSAMQVRAHLNDLELRSKVAATEIAFKSAGPIEIDAAGGEATIRDFRLNGRGTDLAVAGSFPYFRGARPGRVSAKGTVDLAMVQAFTAQVQSSGLANVALELTGNPWNPKASGTITVKDASLASSNFPSDLTGLNGTIEFNQTKASIQKLTAQTGGGRITFGGFVNYGAGPIVYSLNAAAEEVRIRSAGGLSVTATSQLQLTGTSERSMLSGSTTISRVLLNSNMDLGTLLASIATPAVAPGNEKDLLTGMQFDVSIESAPDLQVSTAFSSDVEADIDLRLRGTRDHPTLLGSIFANEGDVKVFGTRYSINRGEVSFVNAARIEPVLNLDVQTEVRGIVVDITIAGPVGRLNVNYRSDPPLLPRDIIALLTVGRTPEPASNIPSSQNTNEVTSLQAGGNTLLGQALTPSNRLSKLFGITNIRIDPMVQGLTAVPQARLTLEQQLSKQISVTYVTNLSQTSEQIFRVEWTFSPHYSLVILRDDNGEFGLDIQYRKRFK